MGAIHEHQGDGVSDDRVVACFFLGRGGVGGEGEGGEVSYSSIIVRLSQYHLKV